MFNELYMAAKTGRLNALPRSAITVAGLTYPETINGCAGRTRWGYLEQIPSEILSSALLLVKDVHDHTPLHDAAWYGSMHQLPAALLTSENLMVMDDKGWTPLYCAAIGRNLDQIPSEVLTVENLMTKIKRPLVSAVFNSTPLLTAVHAAIGYGRSEPLLGIDFPEYVKEVVGEEWWGRNRKLVLSKRGLMVESESESCDISVF